MFNFSKLSGQECQRLHHLLGHIGPVCELGYKTGEMAQAFHSLTYADIHELAPGSRAELNELFDKAYIVAEIDKAENVLRQAIIKFLELNDRNGIYSDDDLLAEDSGPMPLEAAAEALSRALSDD